jgi:hypothetical protein
MQFVVTHEPMKVAVLGANGAVAVGQGIDRTVDLEPDFSAVTSACIAHRRLSIVLMV